MMENNENQQDPEMMNLMDDDEKADSLASSGVENRPPTED